MDRAIAALHDKELAALRTRVAELEAVVRLWDEWHTDNCCISPDPDRTYPPPLSETYAALDRTALAQGGDDEE